MKLSFSLAKRRMQDLFNVESIDSITFFSEDGMLVGALTDEELLQLFVNTTEGVKLLVLAKNFKKKSGQDLTVADVIFIRPFDGKNLVSYIKNRQFGNQMTCAMESRNVRTLGTVEVTEKQIRIQLPDLLVDEEWENEEFHVVTSRTKRLKGEHK